MVTSTDGKTMATNLPGGLPATFHIRCNTLFLQATFDNARLTSQPIAYDVTPIIGVILNGGEMKVEPQTINLPMEAQIYTIDVIFPLGGGDKVLPSGDYSVSVDLTIAAPTI